MKKKYQFKTLAPIILKGTQIKRVNKGGKNLGVISMPRELVGNFVRISLLSKKEQKDLENNFNRIKELESDLQKRKERLELTHTALKRMRSSR